MTYVVTDEVVVDPTCPPLAINQPFLSEHRSVKDDLIIRASHNNGLYNDDCSEVYFKLEEATRGT